MILDSSMVLHDAALATYVKVISVSDVSFAIISDKAFI